MRQRSRPQQRGRKESRRQIMPLLNHLIWSLLQPMQCPGGAWPVKLMAQQQPRPAESPLPGRLRLHRVNRHRKLHHQYSMSADTIAATSNLPLSIIGFSGLVMALLINPTLTPPPAPTHPKSLSSPPPAAGRVCLSRLDQGCRAFRAAGRDGVPAAGRSPGLIGAADRPGPWRSDR